MSDDQQTRRPDGAMTDATGNLTAPDHDDEFLPAERRAIERPEDADRLTRGARRRRATDAVASDEPGSLDRRPLETLAPNERDGGYGSEHGLAADDPAYAFRERTMEAAGDSGARSHEDGDDRQANEERY